MSVTARVSRSGARDQTEGALENTGVGEGLRLNIRNLRAGGENRVRRLKHPAIPPGPDNICQGRGIRVFRSLPLDCFGDQPNHTGQPRAPGPSIVSETQGCSILDGSGRSKCEGVLRLLAAATVAAAATMALAAAERDRGSAGIGDRGGGQIGRASCRERV